MRALKLDSKTQKKIAFYYPCLSPGELTSVTMDDQGTLRGEVSISPTVPILDDLLIKYEAPRDKPDRLWIELPIPADKLKPSTLVFRFTGGSLSLQLAPSFLPKGDLTFSVGPAASPVIVGDFSARLEGGAFVATGTLKPGAKAPGVKDAAGSVSFHSETGWSGKLAARTTPVKDATIDAELGFNTKEGKLVPYGKGGLHAAVRGNPIDLGVSWHGGPLGYSGAVTVKNPMPLVKEVTLKGSYTGDRLAL